MTISSTARLKSRLAAIKISSSGTGIGIIIIATTTSTISGTRILLFFLSFIIYQSPFSSEAVSFSRQVWPLQPDLPFHPSVLPKAPFWSYGEIPCEGTWQSSNLQMQTKVNIISVIPASRLKSLFTARKTTAVTAAVLSRERIPPIHPEDGVFFPIFLFSRQQLHVL